MSCIWQERAGDESKARRTDTGRSESGTTIEVHGKAETVAKPREASEMASDRDSLETASSQQ
jgi:hypothetical protein